MQRIAFTAINGRIMFSTVNKARTDFTGVTQDMTSDCVKEIIDTLGAGGTHVVTVDGQPAFEISVKKLEKKV